MFAFGTALSLFLVVSYLICVLRYLILPRLPIYHAALAIFLPGFVLLTWASFFLGLVETFTWGWYVDVIFGRLGRVIEVLVEESQTIEAGAIVARMDGAELLARLPVPRRKFDAPNRR